MDANDKTRCRPIPFDSIAVAVNGLRIDATYIKSYVIFSAIMIYGIPLSAIAKSGPNTLSVTYTSATVTPLDLTFDVRLVRLVSVSEIVNRVVSKQTLSRESCLEHVKASFRRNVSPLAASASSNDEIAEVSRKVSLRDPVSFSRIKIPVRGITCQHVQCCDLESFLVINLRNPSFKCALCSEIVPIEGVVVDSYFKEILDLLADTSTQEVVIQNTGDWSAVPQEANKDASVDEDNSADEEASTAAPFSVEEREKRKNPPAATEITPPPKRRALDAGAAPPNSNTTINAT